ncbi:MAG TPA: DUF4440 domain-containing protein [Bryobacteraceae bacterium]|nr:DUF4440 domain-containing protein [Bryobacteraceae bacterium]
MPILLALGFVAQGQQSAREQVRKVLADQMSAWNRGDLVAFMQTYAKSPDLTFFSDDTIERGWEAILARYRNKYQSSGKEMGQLSFTDEEIDMLGPNAAVATARWRLLLHDGKRLEGLTTVILKQTKDGWKIVHDHSS